MPILFTRVYVVYDKSVGSLILAAPGTEIRVKFNIDKVYRSSEIIVERIGWNSVAIIQRQSSRVAVISIRSPTAVKNSVSVAPR